MSKKYLQEGNAENIVDDRTFILLTMEEFDTYSDSECLNQKECVYSNEGYKVFVDAY